MVSNNGSDRKGKDGRRFGEDQREQGVGKDQGVGTAGEETRGTSDPHRRSRSLAYTLQMPMGDPLRLSGGCAEVASKRRQSQWP